ncbi:hypothetical protein D9M68_601040 [compost metagenome]
MLQYKNAIFCNQFAFDNDSGQIIYFLQGIRRSGKDEIILIGTLCQEFKHITLYEVEVFDIQFLCGFSDECCRYFISFYNGQICCPAGCQFITDAAGTTEDIQGFSSFKIN